jgi:hypothetical protein
MLRWLAVKLTPPPEEYEQKCAYMEAFTIHARNLRDFLWEDDPWWAVGKFVAHVTHDRPPPGDEKQWKVGAIAEALDDCIGVFRAEVERSRSQALDPCWRSTNARFIELRASGDLTMALSNSTVSVMSTITVIEPDPSGPGGGSV